MNLDSIRGVDIYLLDQLLKGNISKTDRILDVGCGSGRNLIPLLKGGFDVLGFDPKWDQIEELQHSFPNEKDRFQVSNIQNFQDEQGFSVIICNAVLHFAKSNADFDEQFKKLYTLLQPEGMLFIRMTSNIGLESLTPENKPGVYQLPDDSTRYLITRKRVDELISHYNLTLIEPVKTVNVDGLRCMTTLVLKRIN